MKQGFRSRTIASLLSVNILMFILLIPTASAGSQNGQMVANPTIYFTEAAGKILSVDAQGQNETVLAGPLPLARMAYDGTAQKVYGATGVGDIRRMNPDGTGLETLLTGLDNPTELTLDPANGKMYWFDRRGAAIERASLDGSGLETVVPSEEVSDGEYLGLDSAGGKLYWIRDESEIRRANLDGSSVETIVPGQSFNELLCLVLDVTNQKLYWVNDGGSDVSFIGRSDLDGSNSEQIVPLPDFPDVSCPLVDTVAGLIYWGDADDDAIKSANLDGTNVQIPIPALDSPRELAFGPAGKLYWSENGGGATIIRRANANGSQLETLVTELRQVFLAGPLFLILGDQQKLIWNDWNVQLVTADLDGSDATVLFQAPGQSYGIAVDEVNNKLYWADRGSVARSNIDGTGVEIVVPGLNAASAVAVDPAGGKLYWTDSGLGLVQCSNLDGSSVETLYTYAIRPTSMSGLAVDDANGKLYWVDSRFGGGNYAGTLWQSNLDGSGAVDFVTGLGNLRGTAINRAGTMVYSLDGQKVLQIDVFDKSVSNLVTGPDASGSDIALDEGNGHLYWTAPSAIRRADVTGGTATTIYTGQAYPFYLAVPRSKANEVFSDSFEDVL